VAVGFFFFFFFSFFPLTVNPQQLLIILIEMLSTTKVEKNSGLYVIYCIGIFRDSPPVAVAMAPSSGITLPSVSLCA
jgi:hypothetical protein